MIFRGILKRYPPPRMKKIKCYIRITFCQKWLQKSNQIKISFFLWLAFILTCVFQKLLIRKTTFSGSVPIGTEGLFSSLTKVTTLQSGDVDRSSDSLETEAAERFVQLYLEKKARSMFQCLPSRTQLEEERLLCFSLFRFERFSPSLVCNVPLILAWWFPPLLEYFLLTMRS